MRDAHRTLRQIRLSDYGSPRVSRFNEPACAALSAPPRVLERTTAGDLAKEDEAQPRHQCHAREQDRERERERHRRGDAFRRYTYDVVAEGRTFAGLRTLISSAPHPTLIVSSTAHRPDVASPPSTLDHRRPECGIAS
jgi:hypothetical protein